MKEAFFNIARGKCLESYGYGKILLGMRFASDAGTVYLFLFR